MIARRFPAAILLALVSVVTPANAVDNAEFVIELEGAKPTLWRDYEPLYHDFVSCIAGLEPRRLTRPVCTQINERRGRMLWDAIKQAVWLNIASPGGQGFCDAHATKIVFDQNTIEGRTIAAAMIDLQLHGGTGPYGADLPITYLGKIVYDALVNISPCKQK
jgi:hypothetical protein